MEKLYINGRQQMQVNSPLGLTYQIHIHLGLSGSSSIMPSLISTTQNTSFTLNGSQQMVLKINIWKYRILKLLAIHGVSI